MNDVKTLLKKDLISIVKEVMFLTEQEQKEKKTKTTTLIQVTAPEEGEGLGLSGSGRGGGGSTDGSTTGTTTGTSKPTPSGEKDTEERTQDVKDEFPDVDDQNLGDEEEDPRTVDQINQKPEEQPEEQSEELWNAGKIESLGDDMVQYTNEFGNIQMLGVKLLSRAEVEKIDKFKNDDPYAYRYFSYIVQYHEGPSRPSPEIKRNHVRVEVDKTIDNKPIDTQAIVKILHQQLNKDAAPDTRIVSPGEKRRPIDR